MPPREIQLVIFDLGRVMIRLCDGWKHACERAGVPYRPGWDSESEAFRQKLLDLVILNETGQLDHEEWARKTAELAGMAPAHITAISHAWLDGPFPGWPELLDRLEKTTVRTACLSNTNALHWQLMSEGDGPHRLPLERLHFRFASQLIGSHKPDAAIYRHVEQATGVPPRSILFFDDAGPNVLAARECGWSAQVIEPQPDPVQQITRHLIDYGVFR